MPIVTVTTPVTDRGLVSLADVKADLGITDTSKDALLTRWIAEASDALAAACGVAPDQRGRRTWLAEPLTISYRPDEIPCWSVGEPDPLVLPWRLPLTIDTLTVGGVALTATADDYELEPMACLLWRLDSSGRRRWWEREKVVIIGTAGFDKGAREVPAALAKALSGGIKGQNDAQSRDAALKRERVNDVGEREYFSADDSSGSGGVTGASAASGVISDDVMAMLTAAGLVNIAIG